jgi:hypothetical protein
MAQSAKWNAAVDRFSERYGDSAESAAAAIAAMQALAEALDNESPPAPAGATRPRSTSIEPEFFDDLLRYAERPLVWLDHQGFEIRQFETKSVAEPYR